MKNSRLIFCLFLIVASLCANSVRAKTFEVTEYRRKSVDEVFNYDPKLTCEQMSDNVLLSRTPSNARCEKLIVGEKVCFGDCKCLYSYVLIDGKCIKYDCDNYPYTECPDEGLLENSCQACPHDAERFTFSCDEARGWIQDGTTCKCDTSKGLIQVGASCVCDEDVRGYSGIAPNCSCKPCPNGYATTTLTCDLNYNLVTSGISCGENCNKCIVNTCGEGNVSSTSQCGGTPSAWRLKPYAILPDGTICRKCHCENLIGCNICTPTGYTLITDDMSEGAIQNLFVANAKLILGSNITVTSGIKITAAGIVFDGNGYTLSSSGTDVAAITVEGKNASATVTNLNISVAGTRAAGVKVIGGGTLTIDNLDGIEVSGAESVKYHYRDEGLFKGKEYTRLLYNENSSVNAAQYANSYVPDAIRLHKNSSAIFGAGNWYVGTIGEWFDLMGYDYSAVTTDLGTEGYVSANNFNTINNALNVVKQKMNVNLLYEWAASSNNYYWTTTENSTTSAWMFQLKTGQRTYDYKRESDTKHLRLFSHVERAFDPAVAEKPEVGDIMYADGTWSDPTATAMTNKIEKSGIYPVGIVFNVNTVDASVKVLALLHKANAAFGSSEVNYSSLPNYTSTKKLYNSGKLIVLHRESLGNIDYCSRSCTTNYFTTCPNGANCSVDGDCYKFGNCKSKYSKSGYNCNYCGDEYAYTQANCPVGYKCTSSCGGYYKTDGCADGYVKSDGVCAKQAACNCSGYKEISSYEIPPQAYETVERCSCSNEYANVVGCDTSKVGAASKFVDGRCLLMCDNNLSDAVKGCVKYCDYECWKPNAPNDCGSGAVSRCPYDEWMTETACRSYNNGCI